MDKQILSYNDYILSDTWRNRHKGWLKRTDHRCQLFPWLRVGRRVKGKYHPYAVHHMHRNAYKRQGCEAWNRDVLVLSPLAHDFIFHGVASGFKRRTRQQKDFPNPVQRTLNWYCRFIGVLLWLPPVCTLIIVAIALATGARWLSQILS